MSFDSYLDSLQEKLKQRVDGTVSADFYFEDGVDLRKRAPNAVVWVSSPDYLNIPELYDFPRQYQILRDYHQLRCPICNTGSNDCWGKTPAQLRAETLLEWDESIEEDVCPRCKSTRSELEDDGLLHRYDSLVGIAGMRSGKSVVAGFEGTYQRHVFTTLAIAGRGTLHRYFGTLPTQPLEMAFVATTSTQSNQTIWANFFNQCKASPWFKRYVTWVKKRESEQPSLPGVRKWRYNENADAIEDGWCFFNCVSLHSNSGSLAGRTRLSFFVDELARFNTGDSKLSADEVWAVFDHSLKTVRGAKLSNPKIPAFVGTALTVTSPISIEDKALVLYNQGKTLANWYVWKYPTWLFNPKQPRENFDTDYATDPIMAERDFGANPPNASTPLVEQPHLYVNTIDKTAVPTASFEMYDHQTPTGVRYIGAKIKGGDIGGPPLFIFGDAGVTFDQFGLVACSPRWLAPLERKDRVDIEQDRIQSHMDLIAGVRRAPDEKRDLTIVTYHEWSLRLLPTIDKLVWFESVVDIIRELQKKRKIAMVAFDNWNSQATMQQIQQMGIPTQSMNVTAEDFRRAVQDAYTYRLRLLPWDEEDGLSLNEFGTLQMAKEGENLSAAGATVYEMLRLERSEDLKRVYNPNKGKVRGRNSNDLASCLVGAHRLVQESLGLTRPDRRVEKQSREVSQSAGFSGRVFKSPLGS